MALDPAHCSSRAPILVPLRLISPSPMLCGSVSSSPEELCDPVGHRPASYRPGPCFSRGRGLFQRPEPQDFAQITDTAALRTGGQRGHPGRARLSGDSPEAPLGHTRPFFIWDHLPPHQGHPWVSMDCVVTACMGRRGVGNRSWCFWPQCLSPFRLL